MFSATSSFLKKSWWKKPTKFSWKKAAFQIKSNRCRGQELTSNFAFHLSIRYYLQLRLHRNINDKIPARVSSTILFTNNLISHTPPPFNKLKFYFFAQCRFLAVKERQYQISLTNTNILVTVMLVHRCGLIDMWLMKMRVVDVKWYKEWWRVFKIPVRLLDCNPLSQYLLNRIYLFYVFNSYSSMRHLRLVSNNVSLYLCTMTKLEAEAERKQKLWQRKKNSSWRFDMTESQRLMSASKPDSLINRRNSIIALWSPIQAGCWPLHIPSPWHTLEIEPTSK